MSVDDFIEKKVLPQYRSIVYSFRALMHELAPEVQEIIYRGIPGFRGKRLLAVISPTKNGITFSFAHGALFLDTYGFLEGVGKTSRVVRLKSLDADKIEALRYYIKQAVDLDRH